MRSDPRLVDLYDSDNPGGADHEWYRALADRTDACTVVDLGCGTGLLTVTLATADRTVVGIDPDEEMLDRARRRPGGDAVRWVHGDSAAIAAAGLGAAGADLVLMSGNVAQHVPQSTWRRTLRDVAAALRPGGTLAFETRNPVRQAWWDWAAAPPSTRSTVHGPLTEWTEVGEVQSDGTVDLVFHNVVEDTGEHLVVRQPLVFRDRDALEGDLAAAGLVLGTVRGGWSGEELTTDSPLLVVESVRP